MNELINSLTQCDWLGNDCELEINECERFQPCVNGQCVDLIADYECQCPDNYGGNWFDCSLSAVSNRSFAKGSNPFLLDI